MKKILLITTGGTISCGSGETALSPALCGAELLNFISADSDLIIDCSDLLFIDSTSVKPKHWELIANEIRCKADKYDGFVITHGTDTLAYTASMLSFLLCRLNKPVIITGSQKTMFEEKSDAPDNLSNAIKAACTGIGGVYILFGSRIIYGTRGYKESTSSFDGFVSVNKAYAGKIENGKICFNCDNCGYLFSGELPNDNTKSLEARIISINITPSDNGEIIRACADSGYDGIVLSSYGTGGLPDKGWEAAASYAISKGILVAMTSQCRHGIIIPSRYAVAGAVERLGILSAADMTLESAYCKLLWLLSVTDSRQKAAELFAKNICGEVTTA